MDIEVQKMGLFKSLCIFRKEKETVPWFQKDFNLILCGQEEKVESFTW